MSRNRYGYFVALVFGMLFMMAINTARITRNEHRIEVIEQVMGR